MLMYVVYVQPDCSVRHLTPKPNFLLNCKPTRARLPPDFAEMLYHMIHDCIHTAWHDCSSLLCDRNLVLQRIPSQRSWVGLYWKVACLSSIYCLYIRRLEWLVWHGGVLVRELVSRSRGRGFDFHQSFHFHLTTLIKLFTHMCLCHQAV